MKLTEEERLLLITLRFDNARQALDDAECLLQRNSLRAAMNRCYYAVFYAASALAVAQGATFRKHSGLIAYFHAEYVKPGLLDRKLGRILQSAFDNRSEADYQDLIRFTKDDVEASLQEAVCFVDKLNEYLQS